MATDKIWRSKGSMGIGEVTEFVNRHKLDGNDWKFIPFAFNGLYFIMYRSHKECD